MDDKAKKILFRTYWKNGGWVDDESAALSREDFLYAKEKGLMFEPFSISHDDCILRVVALAKTIARKAVAAAFMSSLSSRRLDWRSAIASWFIAKQFTPHTYTPKVSGHSYDKNGAVTYTAYACSVCGEVACGITEKERYVNSDLNVLNFERLKWGGVRHEDLLYTLFDLEQFQKETIPEPSSADIALFKAMLEMIERSAPGEHPGKLRDRLANVPGFKSSKAERGVLLEILACIGVLEPASFDRPVALRSDWHYAAFWRGEDKYSVRAARDFFGEYLG